LENTPEYYARRCAKERELAAAAKDPQIAKIHEELAEHYEILLSLGPRPADDGVEIREPSRRKNLKV